MGFPFCEPKFILGSLIEVKGVRRSSHSAMILLHLQ